MSLARVARLAGSPAAARRGLKALEAAGLVRVAALLGWKAGLRKGDVLRRVGPTAVTDLDTAINAVRDAKPGSKLEFQVRRDGKGMTVVVTVGVFPLHFSARLD